MLNEMTAKERDDGAGTSSPVQGFISPSSQQQSPNDSVRAAQAAPQNASAGCASAPQRAPESVVFVLNIPARIFFP